MSTAEKAPQVQILPVAATFNDTFEVMVDGVVVGVVAWRQLKELASRQLALSAPATIRLEEASALVVYERRTSPGSAGSNDAICLEVGLGKVELSANAARDLAKVLLAYGEQSNYRGQWLVRQESV